ncbi:MULTISPECIES: hypothetical protein [unclassified Labrenzia]|uniref:hypothetical protein n=1 Tax=unclassified Labrenzia TaxID=2648686 RepID=UPI00137688BA|nr:MULTISPECIES: hypothetical protein [unclassified Labrenzia]
MPSEKAQIDKFKEAAKELGCDESEEAFDANLKRIARKNNLKENEVPKKEQ